MVFLRAKHEPNSKFVYAIFGIQYIGASPSGRQKDLIQQFEELIKGQAHVDRITCPGNEDLGTQIWLSYWKPKDLSGWWVTPKVSSFWQSLPSDAGVWREFLIVDTGRFQNACSAEGKHGVNGLDSVEEFSEHIGYWGCYRDRLPLTTPEERFNGTIQEVPPRVPEGKTIRYGRTVITEVPDNILFLVEGQDHSYITAEERKRWFEGGLDDLVTGWMKHLGDKAVANGILDAKMGYVPESGTFREKGPIDLDHNRKIQLFYWLDMKKFEHAGRVHLGHVKLRKKFMEDYGPVGPMGNGVGKMILWEESVVLKGKDVEAEYIGCREGTGFMGYDATNVVKSRQVSA